METSNAVAVSKPSRQKPNRILIVVGLLLVLILAIVLVKTTSDYGPNSTLDTHSLADFKKQHGLQLHLIGVIGGGGLIDFRLKINDVKKAQAFLEDPENFPVVLLAEDGTQILAADSMDDEIRWEDGGILFMMLPNDEGLIQRGSIVSVLFGEYLLEAVAAQ